MPALAYDNSAFYYFVLACCTMYLLPATYSIVAKLMRLSHPVNVANSRTTLEVHKHQKIAKEQSCMKAIFSTGFLVQIVACVCLWGLVFWMLHLVWGDSEIATFDPFQTLQLAPGRPSELKSRAREIKKAYHHQSLIYHPDKCKMGKAVCEQAFRKITEARDALTLDQSVNNYIETGFWGEGKTPLAVSIGLPTFMLEEENHMLILAIYLLVLVVVIPSVVCFWYTKSKEYGENRIMNKSYQFYASLLNEHSTVKSMPEILAGSAEFAKAAPFKPEDNDSIISLFKTLSSGGNMQKDKYKAPPDAVKANFLLHAHLTGTPVPTKFEHDLREILLQSTRLIEAMIDLSSQMRWLQTTKNIIIFSQLLAQGQWVKDSIGKASMLQIPHFSDQEVKHAMSGKSGKGIKSVTDFARQDPLLRKGLNNFNETQKYDVEHFLTDLLPNVRMELAICVEDEDEIAERDFVSLKIKLTRNNINVLGGGNLSYVHSPKLPFLKQESWWFMVAASKNKLIAAKQATLPHTPSHTDAPTSNPAVISASPPGTIEQTIQFWAPDKAGAYSFDVYAMSDSYIGLDIHQTINMEVVPAADLPAYRAHEEDLELDNEPTLFEQVMVENADEDSNSDDSDENEDWSDDGDTAAEKERDKACI